MTGQPDWLRRMLRPTFEPGTPVRADGGRTGVVESVLPADANQPEHGEPAEYPVTVYFVRVGDTLETFTDAQLQAT